MAAILSLDYWPSRRGRAAAHWLRAVGRARKLWRGVKAAGRAAQRVGNTMSRVVAVTACGLALAACSMSMPSLDFFKPSPATEVLRVESEPPGADARTSQGQSCRTPCELTVPSGGEMSVSFALNGYQPQTVQVREEAAPTSYSDSGRGGKMQPDQVYAALQSA